MSRKYYEAYDDRYRQVHSKKLQWFHTEPSPIVAEVMNAFGVQKGHKLLESGCGEGRDAAALLVRGYDLLATDVSEAAIDFCKEMYPQYAPRFQVLDCLEDSCGRKYDFLYAIAVVHMLVDDRDREGFYCFIRQHLSENGIALIGTMGDGKLEHSSDISNAFTLQERTHEQTGRVLQIAGTSYRAVSFETFRREIHKAGLKVLKEGITLIEPDYSKVMFAVVKCADEKN